MKSLIPNHLESLDDLFDAYQYITPTRHPRGGTHYIHEPGWYFLSGLPGSIRFGSAALFVKPKAWVRELSQLHLTNGVTGSFRAVQSAHWMKQGLLPVFVQDPHYIASPLLAFVSHREHDRFNK